MVLKIEHFQPIETEEIYSENDPVGIYLHEIGQTPLLTREEELTLAKEKDEQREIIALLKEEMAEFESGSEYYESASEELQQATQRYDAAVKHLIQANLRLVVSISKNYVGKGLSQLDLIQEGNIGLMKGVERYDWKTGNKLSTYATWWIRQAMTRALDDQSRTVRLPAHMNETVGKLSKAMRELAQTLQRRPTDEEVASYLGISVDKLIAVRRVSQRAVSLNQPLGTAEGDGELMDLIEDDITLAPEKSSENTLLRDHIKEALSALTSRERKVIILRFGLEDGRHRTLDEVGQELGFSRERARQIEKVALNKIRSSSHKDKLEGYLH